MTIQTHITASDASYTIGKHAIGPGHPCFIIAEIGVNHNGDVETALQMIAVAAAAGANAVKFQTFNAALLAAPSAEQAAYQAHNTGQSEPQLDMLRRLELSHAAYPRLIAACKDAEIIFLSTAFDFESIDFLASLGDDMPAYKIGSGDTNNIPHLEQIASLGKPVILSTGMSTMDDIAAAAAIFTAQNTPFALLQCTSAYPASPQDINLAVMQTLRDTFNVPIGFSDHSSGIAIPIAAAALGANIIEKHFTLDKNAHGPDHKASLEPDELAAMIAGIRSAAQAIGSPLKALSDDEIQTAKAARKSIMLNKDMPQGTVLTSEDLILMRPGMGLPPAQLNALIGQPLAHDCKAFTPLKSTDIAGFKA